MCRVTTSGTAPTESRAKKKTGENMYMQCIVFSSFSLPLQLTPACNQPRLHLRLRSFFFCLPELHLADGLGTTTIIHLARCSFLFLFFFAAGGEGVDPEPLIRRDIVPVCLGLLPSCAEPSASRCHAGMHLNITGGGGGKRGAGEVGGGVAGGTCSNL